MLTYDSDNGYIGTDYIQYTANDGELTSQPANINITIGNPSLTPTPTTGPGQTPLPTPTPDPTNIFNTTTFPDEHFRTMIAYYMGTSFTAAEAAAYSTDPTWDFSEAGISDGAITDLTGIEFFTSLTSIRVNSSFTVILN